MNLRASRTFFAYVPRYGVELLARNESPARPVNATWQVDPMPPVLYWFFASQRRPLSIASICSRVSSSKPAARSCPNRGGSDSAEIPSAAARRKSRRSIYSLYETNLERVQSFGPPGGRERRQVGQRLAFGADLQVEAGHAARHLLPKPAAHLRNVGAALEVVADPMPARRPALEGELAVVLDLATERHVIAAQQVANGTLGAFPRGDHLLLQDRPSGRTLEQRPDDFGGVAGVVQAQVDLEPHPGAGLAGRPVRIFGVARVHRSEELDPRRRELLDHVVRIVLREILEDGFVDKPDDDRAADGRVLLLAHHLGEHGRVLHAEQRLGPDAGVRGGFRQ